MDHYESSVSQPGLALPSHSMQSQMHELAKTLPPPRKQNTACDACRSRKVKCNRLPGQDKVGLRPPLPETRLNISIVSTLSIQELSVHTLCTTGDKREEEVLDAFPKTEESLHCWLLGFAAALEDHRSLPMRSRFLSYVFAPPENAHPQGSYAQWGELAHKLESDAFKAEFALDLVEVFFQIVHTRMPLLNPDQFRSRLRLQPGDSSVPDEVLHPALVATVIAWGTKFSEHPLLVADRQRVGGQSLLAKTLIDRSRDLAEALKVHRIPSSDHVVIGLLLEPLQNQNPDDPNRFHCFWISAATRHLLELQVNHKAVLTTISAPEARGTMIFAFWMACIADAYGSVYYRHKPVLDDDDYDIDFYTVDPISPEGDGHAPAPNPREQLEFLGYYRAAHALARIARQMSRNLWRPSTDSDGVPFEVLYALTTQLSAWRDEFLTVVGVPSNFEGEWDFVSAVSSCASDATYHVMWVVLFNAVDEFGVKEVNEVTRMNQPLSMVPNYSQIDLVMRKVADEALHGALRISGLAGVLTSNGYLRLDPAVMLVSVVQSGNLLARLGRPEVSNCVAGLEQYSYSYEDAGEQAVDIRRIYNQTRSGELELQHMAAFAPRLSSYEGSESSASSSQQHPPSPQHQNATTSMLVDDLGNGVHSPGSDFGTQDYGMYSR
uniref:Transcription factor domain-containing protein n=1 Tax=Mycena chlorophos TaxID=658473 RepID=A0ABQ0M644_MYCCL|nr:predicted protein [Mycena chlorophos]